MQRVIVESPFAQNSGTARHDKDRNIAYARACLNDCIKKGESPYASHLLYTQEGVLNDEIPEERDKGIQAGFAWREVAEKTIFYVDLGLSKGMLLGREVCIEQDRPFEYRMLGGPWVETPRLSWYERSKLIFERFYASHNHFVSMKEDLANAARLAMRGASCLEPSSGITGPYSATMKNMRKLISQMEDVDNVYPNESERNDFLIRFCHEILFIIDSVPVEERP